jgi:hypothetical protein
MKPMSERNKCLVHSELLTRTTNINADIKLAKGNQWQATYYSLLLSGGMFAFINYAEPVARNAWYVVFPILFYLAIVQAGLVVFLQKSYARSLRMYREEGSGIDRLLNSITGVNSAICEAAKGTRESLLDQTVLTNYYQIVFTIFGVLGPVTVALYSAYRFTSVLLSQ